MTNSTPARMIAFIQQLYDVERAATELPPDARQALRQEHSVPLLAQIDAERVRLASIAQVTGRRGRAVSHESVGRIAAIRRRRPSRDREQPR